MKIQKSTKSGISPIAGIFTVLAVFGLLFAACKQLTLPSTGTNQNTVTVTFDTNGGPPCNAQTVERGGKVNQPGYHPEYEGWDDIFEGWFLDNETFEQEWDFDTPVTQNITLYAKWIPLITFRVDFEITNSPRTAPPQIIPNGERASQPQGLILNGWYLDGWYRESVRNSGGYDLYNLWNFDEDIVTEDITLYAQWVENANDQFTITFDSNGGTYVADQVKVNGGKADEPERVTKEGHVIEGWYTDNGYFTNRWIFDKTPVMEDTVLYAQWLDLDFGLNPPTNIFNVATTAEWNSAVSAITGGGNDQNYIINIIGDFSITGRTANTFGNTSGIKVSIRGEGRTLYLSGNGSILRIGANQTVVLWKPTLRGRTNNTSSLVYISGNFALNGGEISGNTTSTYSNVFGSGVCVASGGTFTMNDGKISGNTVSASTYTYAYGGGVYVYNGGTFIMKGGEISGNIATGNNTTRGGGVYASGTFRISAGTIYGSGEAAGIRNTANSGASLYRGSTGTTQYGVFNDDDEWISRGNLTSPNNTTIRIVGSD